MALTSSNRNLLMAISKYFLMVSRMKQRNRLHVELSHLSHQKIWRIGYTVQKGLYCRTLRVPRSKWALAVPRLSQNKIIIVSFLFPALFSRQSKMKHVRHKGDKITSSTSLVWLIWGVWLWTFITNCSYLTATVRIRQRDELADLSSDSFQSYFLVICCRK